MLWTFKTLYKFTGKLVVFTRTLDAWMMMKVVEYQRRK